jgi:hypothetical protein
MLIAAVMLTFAAVGAAGDMALTTTGDLYRVAPAEDGLVITATLIDGTVVEYLVPQTAGITTSALDLAVDPTLGGIYILWQQDEAELATVNFASYVNEVWAGPVTIAGGDGMAAANPQMMLYRAVDQVEDLDENGEPILIEVATTFLHTSWWSYVETLNDGVAHYMPIPLDEDGAADIEGYDPIVLADLLPYGINCAGIEDAPNLAAPRIFSDPQSGFPHVLAPDFELCLFYILELGHEVGFDPITERRRHTIILRHGGSRHVDTRLPLANSAVEVGRGLSLVLHWDGESSVDYMSMNEEGSSDVMSLALGEDLDHEQAVELIRSLTR